MQVARENPRCRFGTVSLDGTKPVLSEAEGIHANASRHSALSNGHAEAIKAPLKGEVQQLLALAEEADAANRPDGMYLPEAKLAARAAKAATTGRKPESDRGKFSGSLVPICSDAGTSPIPGGRIAERCAIFPGGWTPMTLALAHRSIQRW